MSNLRNGHVALSILGVKGHQPSQLVQIQRVIEEGNTSVLVTPYTTILSAVRDRLRKALDDGSPMSQVDFKKSQCPMSLNLPCPMSPLRYPNVDFKK